MMAKKVIVTKEWHEQAMLAMHEADKHINNNEAFINGLRSFLNTVLTISQRIALEQEIEWFMRKDDKDEFGFDKALHQGCANLHVLNHETNHQDFRPFSDSWLKWLIK